MKKLLALIAALCCLVATTALATPYSPTQSELLDYRLLWADDSSLIAPVPYNDGLGGAEFTITFTPTNHFAYAFFGKNYSNGIDLSSYDSYKVKIRNDNENPWKFELGIFNDHGGAAYSADTKINVDSSATLSIDFSSLDVDFLSDINTIGFWVFENVPIVKNGRNDYTPEFGVAPVPEPGTMVLLGVGFLGLAIYGKRRRNA